jgi:putative oxidoreductase
MDLGLLLIRLAIGLTLAAHGTQKLFGWFGGYGLAGTGGFMEQLGFHPGRRAALFAGLAETLGGLLLALGAATPLAAAIIVGVMVTAIVTVHLGKGFFNSSGGYELPLLLAVASLAVVLTGPGRESVDAALGHTWAGTVWTLVALLIGVLGATAQLLSRRSAPQATTRAA